MIPPSISSTSRSLPSSTHVVAVRALLGDDVDDGDVALAAPCRPSTGESSATMRWSASSCRVTTSSGTSTSRFGTSSVVQSAGSGFACTANSAVKLHASASLVGSS